MIDVLAVVPAIATPTPMRTLLALERRLAVLSLAALCLAGADAVLMQACEIVIRCVTFPEEMRARFLALYGLGSFGVLKLVMIFTCCTELVRRQRSAGGTGFVPRASAALDAFLDGLPAVRKAVLHRGRKNWSVLDSFYAAYGIIYCVFVLFCIFITYFDTLACYTKGRRYYAGGGMYEACSWFGVRTDDFAHCKTARGVLFLLQMLSLIVAIFPVTVHGLAFAVTAYKIYSSSFWMSRQLGLGRTKRQESGDELYALEAQDKKLNGSIRQDSDRNVFGSNVECFFEEPGTEIVKPFEISEKQWGTVTAFKRD